ncbi:serine hydrolase [Peptococcaceae bacterium]|nr:serine hydrolase [Peptococcaceae bacterium]
MKKIISFVLFLLFVIKADIALANIEKVSLFDQEMAPEYHELAVQLKKVLENEKGTYGIFVIDLKSGRTFGINHLESFHAASTFKLPLNVYLYRQIACGLIDDKKKLLYLKKHYEGGTGILQYKPVGSAYSIAELSKYSIVYSDNVATNILISYLGMKSIKKYMREVGGLIVVDNKNLTNPRDMALYMYDFLEFHEKHPEIANVLMQHFKNTIFRNRIPKLLPENILIVNKTGDWPLTQTYNDVAYINHPVNPYVIAVFSKNTASRDRAYRVISKISKLVYDYQFKLVDVELFINNKPWKPNAPVFLKSSRVWVPVREFSEALCAKVHWRESDGVVCIIKPNVKIEIDIDENLMVLNDEEFLKIEIEIIDRRAMMPVRTIAQALKAGIVWNSDEKSVNVVK